MPECCNKKCQCFKITSLFSFISFTCQS